MTRFTRAARDVATMAAAVALALHPMAASAQSPPNCNANLLDETISRSTATAGPGDIVTYLVTATDRTLSPPGCTPGPGCQVGCDVVVTTASFCCPDATGNPPMPPSPLCTTLVTNDAIPAQDNTVVLGICAVSGVICRFKPTDCPGPGDSCGPFPCTMPNIVGDATSGVFGHGTLDDGFNSPFLINKTIAVAITTTTTTTTTTSTTTTTLPPTPPDFDCYQTPRKNTISPQSVSLVDRFNSFAAIVVNYHRLCAPSNKNDDNPGAENLAIHYAAGTLTKIAGAVNRPKGLQITYQFGTIKADLGAPSFLFLPAGKNPNPNQPAPPPPAGFRHLQCYKLANVSGHKSAAGISVVDQFASNTLSLSPRGPWRLCVPVNKNGQDPTAPADLTDNLLCNTALELLPFGGATVNVDTQFGQKKLTVTQFDDLCMPALLSVP